MASSWDSNASSDVRNGRLIPTILLRRCLTYFLWLKPRENFQRSIPRNTGLFMMLLWPLHAHTGAEIKGRFPHANFGERDIQNISEKGGDNLFFMIQLRAFCRPYRAC